MNERDRNALVAIAAVAGAFVAWEVVMSGSSPTPAQQLIAAIQANPPANPVYDPTFDVNGDGVIDRADLVLVADHFGARRGTPLYVVAYDFDGDGLISILDLSIMAQHYGARASAQAVFVGGDPAAGGAYSIQVTTDLAPAMIGGVKYTVDGAPFHEEHFAPYCMFGDDGTTCTRGRLATDGVHTVDVTVVDPHGRLLITVPRVTFTQQRVPSSPPPPPPPSPPPPSPPPPGPPPPATDIWLNPIPAGATYTPVGFANFPVVNDIAFWSVDPSFPVRTLTGQNTAGGPNSVQVHCDPTMSHNGSWNGCVRFLATDGTLWEGQPLTVSPGGNPHVQYMRPLAADRREGAHGGSALSMEGTFITNGVGDLVLPPGVLGCNVDGRLYLNPNPPFVYPAYRADAYYNNPNSAGRYGGTGPAHMGSRLAIRRDANLTFITDPVVLQIAHRLQTHGAWICDDTFNWQVFAFHATIAADNRFPSGAGDAQLRLLVTMLQVVT